MRDYRACPRCNAEMVYRLGEYACSRCQYVDAPVEQAPVEIEHPADSVKRARLLAPPGGAQAAASTSLGGIPPSEFYTGPALQESGDKLKLEKIIYFTSMTLLSGLGIAATSMGSSAVAMLPGSEIVASSIGSTIVVTVMSLAFQALALFTNVVWLKWTLFILSIIGLILCGIGVVGSFMLGPRILAAGVGLVRLSAIASMCIAFWCMSLIYRDIQLTVEGE